MPPRALRWYPDLALARRTKGGRDSLLVNNLTFQRDLSSEVCVFVAVFKNTEKKALNTQKKT